MSGHLYRHPDYPWQILDELFLEAVRLTDPERVAFLDRACADQPALRAAVERMLWADEAAGTFLERPVEWPTRGLADETGESEGETEDVGLRLGSYELVELIAAGGMGAVYRAKRIDGAFERAVAVKMIRRRIVRAEDLQRFRAEREVLARLDHPNIARLLDGGTAPDDRPYLVMELVQGLPIDRYCAEKTLRLSARIELFQQVCSAIEYAHQNLLIHRDIKPDNILVTEEGAVKVLDFGIAKLLEPESLPFIAPVTHTGVRPMTLGYTSPEQIRGQPATTRSEVFVLGALLYELLAGCSPFVAEGALPHEIESAICEADGLPGGAGRRVRQIRGDCSRAMRGDLGRILGKALRADPARRYGSVEQLSDDLRRWAEHRPVRARPDRLLYRLRTFVRRNQGLVFLALTVFTGLAILSLALWAQTRTAVGERDRAEKALGFVAGIFEGADPGRQGAPPVDPREVLDRGADRIERELNDHPDMQAVLFEAIGRMYTSLGWYDEAVRLLEQSQALRRRLEADPVDVATGHYHLGRALHRSGQYQQARERYEESLTTRRDLLGPEHPAVAEVLAARADADIALGHYDQAEPSIREALRLRRAQLGDDHLDVAESLSSLGDVLYLSQKDTEGVLRAYREALAIREAALGGDHLLVANALGSMATGLFHAGRGHEALPLIQRAVDIKRSILSSDHPELARMLHDLGELARMTGSSTLAETSLREAIEVARLRLGPSHPDTASAQLSLGALLVQQGRLDEAEEPLQQVQRAYEALFAADHPQLASLAFWRGDLLRRRGDYDGAGRLFEDSWRIVERHTPPGTIVRATVKVGRGRLALDSGAPETALVFFEDALAIMRRRSKPEWFIGEVEAELGWCQALLGRVQEGRAMLLSGLEKLESGRPVDDPKVIRARGFLRQIEARDGDARAEGSL